MRQTEKADKEKQVAQLKEQVKQVAEFEQRKKQLEDKNRIIDQLEKSRVGPVKVMDHVSQSLEPLKLWLVRVGVTGQNIDIEGRALTNDDVVEFVNNLRRTDYFMDINLLESRAAVESQVSLYQFKLGFRLKG
jgi:type IV pilus assembly protein PilN